MPDFKTTFIPQKPIVPAHKERRKTALSPILLIALVVFFAVLLTAGGLYGYKLLLVRNIELKQADIKRIEESINPEVVRNLKETDTLFKTVSSLLESHLTLTPLFSFLETATLQTLRFKNFNFQVSRNGALTLSLTGEARDYSSIALQADIFEKEPGIVSPLFSNFKLTDRGTVDFNLNAEVEKSMLLYARKIENIENNNAVPEPFDESEEQE